MNEPKIADRTLSIRTPGVAWATTKKATIWRTRTAIPVRISERGTTIARTMGRRTALKRLINTTATIEAVTVVIAIPGRSAAVTANDTAATIRVTRSRFARATRP